MHEPRRRSSTLTALKDAGCERIFQEQISGVGERNANKKWTRAEEQFLLTLYHEGNTLRQISQKMGRSQTSIVIRLGKLGVG